MGISFNTRYLKKFVNQSDFLHIMPEVKAAYELLYSRESVSKGVAGWLDLPINYNKDEFKRVKECADRIRQNCDIFVVIGIGGSYLGARAAIEFLNSSNYNLLPDKSPKIFFVGNNLDSTQIYEIMALCKGKRVCVNVISKSGTTTEPAIAFRIFKRFMEDEFGKKEAQKRIFCTTDKHRGTLRAIAEKEGYESFTIPDDIGGRFSVLSSVGLFPIAVSGANVDEIMLGAALARDKFMKFDLETNACCQYAAARNILYRQGKAVEIFVAYSSNFAVFLEWLKQLYAESEGKDGKGIFPSSAIYSTDLHSLGQFVQEGSRILFETSLIVKNEKKDIELKSEEENLDCLNFLSGKRLSEVKKAAYEATALAHYDGGVPVIEMEIEENSEKALGELIYFFEKSCAISGLILGVNPFNQPGVEAYKKNMFALMGKPGYEDMRNYILNKLNYG